MKKQTLLAATLLTALCVSGAPVSAQAAGKTVALPNNVQVKVFCQNSCNANTSCIPKEVYAALEQYLANCNPNLQLIWNQSKGDSCNGPECDQQGQDVTCNGSECGQQGQDVTCNGPDCQAESTTPSNTENQALSYEEQVVALVNAERAKEGLPALKIDATLQSAALARAKETVQLFSHTRPNGSSCFTILNEYGISYRTAGENIAYGQRSPEEVVNAWMNSEGHRANIMNKSFTTIGIGYHQAANGTKYWSQLFIS